MLRHRRLVLGLLGVLGAVALLARVGSNATAAPMDDGQNICNDEQAQGDEEVCQENSEHHQCGGDGEGHRRCVSLCRDIQPIFDNRCVNCHNPNMLTRGLDLTAGNSYAYLVNQPTSPTCMMTAPDSVRVVPCNPAASMLWLKLRPDDARCGRPMPFGSDGLGVIAPAEFALIEAWIAQGARNN
jgi:hypothetical protein